MELSSEQWVMTQLPKLQNHRGDDSDDNDDRSTRRIVVPPAQIIPAHLARPYVAPIPVNRARSPTSPTHSSTSLGTRRRFSEPSSSRDDPPWPNKKRRLEQNDKDPFGRETYDGPYLRNGLVNGADLSPDDFTPIGKKRAHIADETNINVGPLPSVANRIKKGMLGDGSTGFGMGGRRVRSVGTFKTPFRSGFDPLAPAPPLKPRDVTPPVDCSNDNNPPDDAPMTEGSGIETNGVIASIPDSDEEDEDDECKRSINQSPFLVL